MEQKTEKQKFIEEYNGRFRSGNSIPVDRIWMTKEMWLQLRDLLETLE